MLTNRVKPISTYGYCILDSLKAQIQEQLTSQARAYNFGVQTTRVMDLRNFYTLPSPGPDDTLAAAGESRGTSGGIGTIDTVCPAE